MSLTERERLESLQLIADTNRRMAERAKAPFWYHPALGLLIGGLIAAQALPLPYQLGVFALYGLGLGLLYSAYKRKTGMWIPGYRAGRTRQVVVVLVVLVAAVFLGSVHLGRESGWIGVYLIAGALEVVIVTLGGFAWEKAYRRDLGVEDR